MDKTNDNCVIKKVELIDLVKVEEVKLVTFEFTGVHILAKIIATSIREKLREAIKNFDYSCYGNGDNGLIIYISIN